MIAVLGAGAFGTALAVTLARHGHKVDLWARTGGSEIEENRQAPRLPGVALPREIRATSNFSDIAGADVVLAAVPTQQLGALLEAHAPMLSARTIVACCKGIDLTSGFGPTGVIKHALPNSRAAILSGPSFAADLGRDLPTALTLAANFDVQDLQSTLSTPVLRLYRSDDPIGVEIGGALKNVVAIACGGAIGAGLGESARAAVMTRGFAEMKRLATKLGAKPETLTGLSGLGDLALTCTSELSRNYRFGLSLGRETGFDPTTTVEGVSTARAALALGERHALDLPIVQQVTRICDGNVSVTEAIQSLLSRPLRAE